MALRVLCAHECADCVAEGTGRDDANLSDECPAGCGTVTR